MTQLLHSDQRPLVIVGEGWCALGAIAHALNTNQKVIWITNSGARMDAPLSTLDSSLGDRPSTAWREMARFVGVELQEPESGTFLREYKNKAFRQPGWMQAPDFGARAEVKDEILFGSERDIPAISEIQFSEGLIGTETKIRQFIETRLQGGLGQKIDEDPIIEIKLDGQLVRAVVLGSGREIETAQICFADRWSEISKIKGIPKSPSFLHRRESGGVLQATFTHEQPIALGVCENFMIALQRESGETHDRHAWGYFFQEYPKGQVGPEGHEDGRKVTKSIWTICFSAQESEDNHEIAKRLRRLKQALNKAFVGPTWVPESLGESALFTHNIQPLTGEVVRFDEHVLFSDGEPLYSPVVLKGLNGICFLTDGYGISAALTQIHELGRGHFQEYGSQGPLKSHRNYLSDSDLNQI